MTWDIDNIQIKPDIVNDNFWECKVSLSGDVVSNNNFTIVYAPLDKSAYLYFNFNEHRSKELISHLSQVAKETNYWTFESVEFDSIKEVILLAHYIAELVFEERDCWGQ